MTSSLLIAMPMLTRRSSPLGGEHDRCRRSASSTRSATVSRLVQRLGALLDQDRELVAAESGDGVAGPDGSTRRRRPPQELVADVVAETVVDGLETVEVQDTARPAPDAVRALRCRRVLDAVTEQSPVGEPGQAVVERLVGERPPRRPCGR